MGREDCALETHIFGFDIGNPQLGIKPKRIFHKYLDYPEIHRFYEYSRKQWFSRKPDEFDIKKFKDETVSLDVNDITLFTHMTKDSLSKVELDFDLLTCTDVRCNNESHKCAIDTMYESVTSALENASKQFLSDKSKCKFTPVPGWNDYVKESHSDAREAFLLWQANGKPRAGPICSLMNKTRARFKRCLRYCKSIEDKARYMPLLRSIYVKIM